MSRENSELTLGMSSDQDANVRAQQGWTMAQFPSVHCQAHCMPLHACRGYHVMNEAPSTSLSSIVRAHVVYR